ncbi:DsbA family protein [Candidatus Micrarchaeota archaeon]|nr:DsbA family protein [Candidatus Micrarchaeota archaeon]
MEKMNLLYILIGVVVVLSFINTYSIFGVGQKIDAVQATIVLSKSDFGGNTEVKGTELVKETEPLGTPPEKVQAKADPTEVSADDDAFLGSEDAPVTIIEFSDYECPFCARFYSQTLPSLKEKYIETGKAVFIYRDFPLGFHQFAQKAAEATECADEQGKFWEMHDKIFENQDALDEASLKKYAEEIGLNSGEFNSCLDSGEMTSEVQKDLSEGQTYGVSGTPSFFINGRTLVGAQPLSAFEQIIEDELAKEGK